MHSIRNHRGVFFLASTLAIVGTCVALLQSRAFAASPEVAAWGITFDLTISVPLLYWFFIVHAGKARPLTIAPVFLLGTLVAGTLLPAGQQRFLRQLGTVVVPAVEVLLAVALVRRVLAARKERNAPADPYERIAAAARTFTGEGRVAEVIASEVAMFYYAFFVWRRRPEPHEHAITFHERNGWATILAGIFVLIAAEGLGMHLLLARWSSAAAWVWTALDLWAIVWFLGDYHALRLRRTWIDAQALHVRYGLRWSVTIPRDLITSVSEIREEGEWKRKDVLKLAMLDDPRWLIALREPVVVRGMAGMRREIRALALLPDQDDWWTGLPPQP